MRGLLALVLVGVAAAMAPAGAAPGVWWTGHPVRANETLLVAGAELDTVTAVNLRSLVSNTSATAHPSHASSDGNTLAFVVPVGFPTDEPFELALTTATTTTTSSTNLHVNTPEVWWFVGDEGDKATPGGYLRLFGRSMALAMPAAAAAATPSAAERQQRQEVIAQLRRLAALARDTGDIQAQLEAAISNIAARAAPTPARLPRAGLALTVSQLRLTATANPKDIVTVGASNNTEFHAFFELPASLRPQTYAIAVAPSKAAADAGLFFDLDCFLHYAPAARQHVSTVSIVPPNPFPASPRFSVPAGAGGLNASGIPNDATAAVTGAIAQAAAAGGGTVALPEGRFWVKAPLLLPHNVLLRGAGMDATAVFFLFENETTAPAAHISNAQPGRFALSDMTMYISGYYNSWLHINTTTNGVRVQRVRVRANAFFCQDYEGRNGSRAVPWTFQGGGYNPLVVMKGANFEVADSDLYSTWSVFHTKGGVMSPPMPDNSTFPGFWVASYGRILRNTIRNGGAAHWFDGAQQMVFEDNEVTGVHPMAMGSNVDTYGGYFAHHVYLAGNTMTHVYGNDRETMTYDNAGTAGFGPLAAAHSPTTLTISPCPQTTSWKPVLGGSLHVFNGTGAGQYRRIVNASRDAAANSCTFVLAAPFAVAPAVGSSWLNAMPFRGANIFENTAYEDTGAFQYYGTGVSTIASGVVQRNAGGFIAWGQERPGFPNQNVLNIFQDIVVESGNGAPHASLPLDPASNFREVVQVNASSLAVMDGGTTYGPVSTLLIFRRNTVLHSGAISVGSADGSGIKDVLVEHNTVHTSAQQQPIFVGGRALDVVVRGNVAEQRETAAGIDVLAER